MDSKIVQGCKVSYHYNDMLTIEGIVQEIQTHLPWNNFVKIKILHDTPFDKKGSIIECFPDKLTFISNTRILKNVELDISGRTMIGGIYMDIDAYVPNRKITQRAFVTLNFAASQSAQNILGEFTTPRIKDGKLLTTLTIYDWNDIYALLFPSVGVKLLKVDKDIPEKVLKFNIIEVSLIAAKLSKKENILFKYLNQQDKKHFRSRNKNFNY